MDFVLIIVPFHMMSTIRTPQYWRQTVKNKTSSVSRTQHQFDTSMAPWQQQHCRAVVIEWCFKHKNLPLWLTRNAKNLMAEALLQLFYLHPDVLDQGLTHKHQCRASGDRNPNPSLLSAAGVWAGMGLCPGQTWGTGIPMAGGQSPPFLMSPECHLVIPTADQIIRGGCQDLMGNKPSIFAGQACKTSLRMPRDLIREDLINLNNLTSEKLFFF